MDDEIYYCASNLRLGSEFGSPRSNLIIESELIFRTLHAFTAARHTELSKRDIYPFVCSGARVSPDFRQWICYVM